MSSLCSGKLGVTGVLRGYSHCVVFPPHYVTPGLCAKTYFYLGSFAFSLKPTGYFKTAKTMQWCFIPYLKILSIRPQNLYFRPFFPAAAWKLGQLKNKKTILVLKIPRCFVKITFLPKFAPQIAWKGQFPEWNNTVNMRFANYSRCFLRFPSRVHSPCSPWSFTKENAVMWPLCWRLLFPS